MSGGHADDGGGGGKAAGLTEKELKGIIAGFAKAKANARLASRAGRTPREIQELYAAALQQHLEGWKEEHHPDYLNKQFAEGVLKTLEQSRAAYSQRIQGFHRVTAVHQHIAFTKNYEEQLKKFLDIGRQVHAKIKWNEEQIVQTELEKKSMIQSRRETAYWRVLGRTLKEYWSTRRLNQYRNYGLFRQLGKAFRENWRFRGGDGTRIGWFARTPFGLQFNPTSEANKQRKALEKENETLMKISKKWEGYLDKEEIKKINAEHYNGEPIYDLLNEHSSKVSNLIKKGIELGNTGGATRELGIAVGEARNWRIKPSWTGMFGRGAQRRLLASHNQPIPWQTQTGWALKGNRVPGVYVPPFLTEHSQRVIRKIFR